MIATVSNNYLHLKGGSRPTIKTSTGIIFAEKNSAKAIDIK